MAGKQKYTSEELIAAAEATGGNKSAVARQLNCDRQTVQNYCNRYITVNRAFEQERQKMVDWAESGLRDAVIDDKEPWAIKFTLATLGKDRGYVPKVETEQVGKMIIEIVHEGDQSTGKASQAA